MEQVGEKRRIVFSPSVSKKESHEVTNPSSPISSIDQYQNTISSLRNANNFDYILSKSELLKKINQDYLINQIGPIDDKENLLRFIENILLSFRSKCEKNTSYLILLDGLLQRTDPMDKSAAWKLDMDSIVCFLNTLKSIDYRFDSLDGAWIANYFDKAINSSGISVEERFNALYNFALLINVIDKPNIVQESKETRDILSYFNESLDSFLYNFDINNQTKLAKRIHYLVLWDNLIRKQGWESEEYLSDFLDRWIQSIISYHDPQTSWLVNPCEDEGNRRYRSTFFNPYVFQDLDEISTEDLEGSLEVPIKAIRERVNALNSFDPSDIELFREVFKTVSLGYWEHKPITFYSILGYPSLLENTKDFTLDSILNLPWLKYSTLKSNSILDYVISILPIVVYLSSDKYNVSKNFSCLLVDILTFNPSLLQNTFSTASKMQLGDDFPKWFLSQIVKSIETIKPTTDWLSAVLSVAPSFSTSLLQNTSSTASKIQLGDDFARWFLFEIVRLIETLKPTNDWLPMVLSITPSFSGSKDYFIKLTNYFLRNNIDQNIVLSNGFPLLPLVIATFIKMKGKEKNVNKKMDAIYNAISFKDISKALENAIK